MHRITYYRIWRLLNILIRYFFDSISTEIHSNQLQIVQPDFSESEIVWAKLRGSPHWPAQVLSFINNKAEIFWFGDGRKSIVFTTQLFKFNSNLAEFSKKCNSNGKLLVAMNEAVCYLEELARKKSRRAANSLSWSNS